MSTKKIIGIGIASVVLIGVVVAIVLTVISNQFRYNEEGAVGNTTGNLYNKGLFCEYKEHIYFANPQDDNSLYRMKKDGTNVEKLHNDTVSYIQVMNDYIYYVRRNFADENNIFRNTLYGIYRLEIGDKKAEMIYNGIVENMVICGNYIYFSAYDDENLIQLKSVKVDGEDLKTISDLDYKPIAVEGHTYYFPNVEDNNNLMYIEAGSTKIATSSEGGFYMPAFTDGFVYYIDLNNDMKLTRVSLKSNEFTVLDEGRCVNFNVSEENNLIYYQLENDDEHMLCRMSTNGRDKQTIAVGDYTDIHITEKYTYYYKIISADSRELYRADNNGNISQSVIFEKIVVD